MFFSLGLEPHDVLPQVYACLLGGIGVSSLADLMIEFARRFAQLLRRVYLFLAPFKRKFVSVFFEVWARRF